MHQPRGGAACVPAMSVWRKAGERRKKKRLSRQRRRPLFLSRLLMLLACDVDDEVCNLLADNPDNPDVMLRMLEILNTWRDSAEKLVGAPYGTVVLFEVGQLVGAWQTAAALLNEGGEAQ